MIKSMKISNVASYKKPVNLENCSKLNFIYGSNASGKTTISKIISDESKFSDCSIEWGNNQKVETLVYNKDFINENLNESSNIKGIFTVGEESQALVKEIKLTKEKISETDENIRKLDIQLNGDDEAVFGKIKELKNIEERIKNKIWNQKQKHNGYFSETFKGFRHDSEKFKKKVLDEEKSNSAELKDVESLKLKSKEIFGDALEKIENIPILDVSEILSLESSAILKKKIIGKEDVYIAEMIKRLDNSDWVKKGVKYYKLNDNNCPFCQQEVEEGLREALEKYFDEAYRKGMEEINNIKIKYNKATQNLDSVIEKIFDQYRQFLNIEKFDEIKKQLFQQIKANQIQIENKAKGLSLIVEVKSSLSIYNNFKEMIAGANSKIIQHNKTVQNLAEEKKKLKSEIWKFLIETELKDELNEYHVEKIKFKKMIEIIENKMKSLEEFLTEKKDELESLESKTTSIQPTITNINRSLSNVGFIGFSLKKADESHYCKLVRLDGTDVKETLSEGEKTFISVLYFCHLLKGNVTNTGIKKNLVVVFDDPVSSLDSDILSVVNSLIRQLFEVLKEDRGRIKQIFIFTHNIYFHKLVSWRQKTNHTKYFTVYKNEQGSNIREENKNPIKSSYEFLWLEVKRATNEGIFNVGFQNTLRKILEYYFNILGGIDYDKIYENFEEEQKIIVQSLISSINEGSHGFDEDLYTVLSEEQKKKQLTVFRQIFNATGHQAHYDMMM